MNMEEIKPYISFEKSNSTLYDGKLLKLSEVRDILSRHNK